MRTIGLQLDTEIPTEKGLLTGTFLRIRVLEGVGKEDNDMLFDVIFDIYESYDRYSAGDLPLSTTVISHREQIEIADSVEVSETTSHAALKTALETNRGWTLTEIQI